MKKNITYLQVAYPNKTEIIKIYASIDSDEFLNLIGTATNNYYNREIFIIQETEEETEKEGYEIMTTFEVRPLYASDDTKTEFNIEGENKRTWKS